MQQLHSLLISTRRTRAKDTYVIAVRMAHDRPELAAVPLPMPVRNALNVPATHKRRETVKWLHRDSVRERGKRINTRERDIFNIIRAKRRRASVHDPFLKRGSICWTGKHAERVSRDSATWNAHSARFLRCSLARKNVHFRFCERKIFSFLPFYFFLFLFFFLLFFYFYVPIVSTTVNPNKDADLPISKFCSSNNPSFSWRRAIDVQEPGALFTRHRLADVF